MNTKIYSLSGLGLDERAFQNLKREGIDLTVIPWIKPLKKESLESYAKRLFESVEIPEKYYLLGVSFGGMIAQEFAKIRQPQKLFLISTMQKRKQLPFIFRLAGAFQLHKIAPMFLLKKASFITYYFFGAQEKEDRKLLEEVLKDTDTEFLRWALGAILKWRNENPPKGITIHGTSDRILKADLPDHEVVNGGHFMVVNRSKEISKILSTGQMNGQINGLTPYSN